MNFKQWLLNETGDIFLDKPTKINGQITDKFDLRAEYFRLEGIPLPKGNISLPLENGKWINAVLRREKGMDGGRIQYNGKVSTTPEFEPISSNWIRTPYQFLSGLGNNYFYNIKRNRDYDPSYHNQEDENRRTNLQRTA